MTLYFMTLHLEALAATTARPGQVSVSHAATLGAK